MKISDILKESIELLDKNKIEDGKMNARRLLANTLNKEKEYLMIHDDEEVNYKLYELYKTKLERLLNHEPLQYILNSQEFMGYDFYVDKNVLIPQPDTENLVEEVIKIVNSFDRYEIKSPKILDLCTGSGAIGISLAKLLPKALVYASDISEEALKIAEENSVRNKANVLYIKSDMFKNIFKEYKFDVIVSNPPYIETEVIKTLSKEVQNEPILALDGGKDGLNFYREIAKNAKNYLNNNGYLALEIGYNQKNAVKKILEENNYKKIYSRKDLSGNDRIVVAQKVEV
jgi:release factor glutamine methyltransferase